MSEPCWTIKIFNLKAMKQKLSNIWEDHKLLLLVAALALALGAIVWHDFFSPDNKETAFCAVVVGQGYDYEREHLLQEQTLAALGLDADERQVIVDTSPEPQLDAEGVPPESAYLDQMKMTAYLTGGEADVVISDALVLEHYNGLGAMMDLREVLSEDQLAAWGTDLYTAENKDGEEIPCGLPVTGGSFSDGGEAYLSVSKKAPHMELVQDFIVFVKGEGE